jgi:hypothetical protein
MPVPEFLTESALFTVDDVDGDGGASIRQRRDVVSVHTWGGAAGPNGCITYVSPADARRLGGALLIAAVRAETWIAHNAWTDA